MEIVELLPSLQSAGAEKFVVELSNEFGLIPNVNVTIIVLYGKNDKDILLQTVSDYVKIHYLGKKRGFSIRCMIQLYYYLKEHKIDIVHAHLSAIPYILLSTLFFSKTKFFATIHSEAKREAEGGVTAMIRKYLFKRRLCLPVTISEESNKSFISFYKLHAPIIYNGIRRANDNGNQDPFLEERKKGATIFTHIARTHKIKNQIILYKCINRLSDEGYNVILYHYGRFYNEEVNNLLMSVKSDRIRIMGEILDVESVLRYSDAMCLSSLMEGMPMTIIEAFSVGCPVISTPVGGCINMVKEGVNGFLSADTSEESYYYALKKFLNTENKKELSAGAYKSFEDYDIKISAKKYYELFIYS